jgi:putative transposase
MTIAELASMNLPGLPSSARGMAKRAQAEGWAQRPGLSRKRKGQKGGGLEYSIEVLPAAARAALVGDIGAPEIEADVSAELELRENDPLSGAERERRDARLHVLAMFEAFRRAQDMTVRDGRFVFSSAWNNGTISAPDWVRSLIPRISKKSIDSWRAIHRDHGPDALGIDRRGRPSILEQVADGQAEVVALAAIAKQEFLSAEHLGAYLRTRFEGELPELSTRTFRRVRARLEAENRNVLMRLRDPDGYRSKVKTSGTNSTFSAGLNDLWQFDASPADVMLKGAKRHSIYMAIDIWSRRTKILVTQSPRADAVAALQRKCMLAWGSPSRIQTDQGSDFIAKATSRLMEALGVDHDVCDAFDPAKKGNVERAIKTFQHDLPVCPGFIGHNVADRKKIEARKAFSRRLGMPDEELFDVDLDVVEFQEWCDVWSDKIYAHSVHSALRGQANTPFLKAASWTGEVRRIANPTALDVLVAPVAGKDGVRRITKQGIKIDGEYYQTAAAWPGEDVFVRMDPTDLGRVLVFSLDGQSFLGEALCPPLAGLDPVEITMKVKAAQKAHEKQALLEIRKEMRAIGPRDFMDAQIYQAEKKAAALTWLERPSTAYSTPALDAAQEALESGQMRVSDYDAAGTQERIAEVVRIPSPRKPAAAKVSDDPFRRAIDLEEAIAAGESISDADAKWLRSYQQHPDYRGAMRIYQLRGRSMFG